MEEVKIENGLKLFVQGENLPLVYLLMDLDEELLNEIKKENFHVNILALEKPDWDRDFSPWPYDRFSGGLNQTLNQLQNYATANRLNNGDTYCVGYSLGGLCALVALTKSDELNGCASVSGSLWYPQLIEYLENHQISNKKIYLSLGDTEANTKHPLMKTVRDKTQQVKELLEKKNHVFFEYNPGNHFYQPAQRTIKALRYLLMK